MIDDPVIDLRRLRVLQEVHRLGTVSAAAGALHLTPSAVSQQLTGLSRDLGVPLLERVGRGVRLTGQAHVLLEHAAVVSEQLERARADLASWSDGVVGQVRIGSLATGIAALVGPTIDQLGRTHPDLDLRVWETEPPEAFELLETGQVEIVVAVDYRDAPLRSDPRYTRVDLLTDVMDLVLPAGHPLATAAAVRDGIRLERLSAERWVSAAPVDPCSLIMTAVCAVAGFSPDVHHYCREWDAVAALVAAGAGVALVPRLAQPLRPPGLVTCPVIGSPTSRLIFAVARAGVQTVPPALTVLDTLAQIAAARHDAAAPGAARPVSAR
ncbi:MAG: LysR family transcriptional regulator [Solirubrobacteraceae bacterium]|nr:LysR family transcriptional regulator [Patulibacter sp.]